MFKKFLSKTGIAKLIDRVRISGATVGSLLNENTDNSKRAFKGMWKRLVLSDQKPETYLAELQKTGKTRKRQTLNTLKNTMSAIRGQARAVAAFGRRGVWANNGTLDSGTTPICAFHLSMTWPQPYSAIPNKPPRIPPVHPCRSFITFVPEGEALPSEAPFMEQFNGSEELRRDLLRPSRFEAIKRGDLPPIKSFAQYERTTLTTLEDLGL